MIGQRDLWRKIKHQIDNVKFPRCVILIGEQGSGKRTLCWQIANQMNYTPSFIEPKADNIREMIEVAYKVDLPVIYVLVDCDNISSSAANALLKVIEEPPHNAYFILTCESADNLLTTIKSRSVTYMLEPYSYEDKCDYMDSTLLNISDDDKQFILDVASNLGDIERLSKMKVSEFSTYVEMVIDNIAEVSGSNALKIGEKIALKDEEDKFNLRLFWKAFNVLCADKMIETNEPLKYARAVAITGDYLQQLSIRGINKSMLFDNWVLEIREEWL